MIKRRILIVEDDLSMEEHLQNDSTDVCSVTTMADALDIFMTQEYCLVSLIVAFFSDQTGKCQEESGQRDKYTSFKK